ncbi:MAG: homoserine kinase [Eubacteriales bacterium]|nr:homoserine kinase [Eubacteriales bacterium]
MGNKRVRVDVPATTANLGPGFDTLGLALNIYNRIEMEENPAGRLEIEVKGEGADLIPRDENNVVYQAAVLFYRKKGKKIPPLKIAIENRIPVSSGLGSSATAIIGGLVAASRLSGTPATQAELLKLAVSLEGHPDNVAPALLGGFTVACLNSSGDVIYHRFSPPPGLMCVVAVPDFPLATNRSREVLPTTVPFRDAVFNVSRAALLVAAFASGDYSRLGEAMADRLHQPYRCPLVPGMEAVFTAAREAGALSVALSGAGPALIAFCREGETAAVKEAMVTTFSHHGVSARILEVAPAVAGALG